MHAGRGSQTSVTLKRVKVQNQNRHGTLARLSPPRLPSTRQRRTAASSRPDRSTTAGDLRLSTVQRTGKTIQPGLRALARTPLFSCFPQDRRRPPGRSRTSSPRRCLREVSASSPRIPSLPRRRRSRASTRPSTPGSPPNSSEGETPRMLLLHPETLRQGPPRRKRDRDEEGRRTPKPSSRTWREP